MKLPLASLEELQEELVWIREELDRMGERPVVSHERAENRRLSLLDHQADVLAQIAELTA